MSLRSTFAFARPRHWPNWLFDVIGALSMLLLICVLAAFAVIAVAILMVELGISVAELLSERVHARRSAWRAQCDPAPTEPLEHRFTLIGMDLGSDRFWPHDPACWDRLEQSSDLPYASSKIVDLRKYSIRRQAG